MSLVAERPVRTTPVRIDPPRSVTSETIGPVWAYGAVVVAGLLMLDLFQRELSYAATTALLGVGLFVVLALAVPEARRTLIHLRIDVKDLLAILALYVTVVAMYRVAFGVIEGNDLLLFAFFGGGMLVGVAGPIYYSVWMRERTLASLGLSTRDLPRVAVLAIIFAGAQFSVTFWGYGDFPDSRTVITLLAMSLLVGIFETIFFRGFIQTSLQRSFGTAPAVFGAAVLYGGYHVGYGMDWDEMVFLVGLGVIYAVAYAAVNNFFIMWPLLTPVGSFFAQLDGGELVGRLPWAALMGIADVTALIVTILWLARRRERKLRPALVLEGPE